MKRSHLFRAVETADLDVLAAWLKKRPNRDAIETTLHYAVSCGNRPVFDLLLPHARDEFVRRGGGLTHVAIERGRSDILAVLLPKQDADILPRLAQETLEHRHHFFFAPGSVERQLLADSGMKDNRILMHAVRGGKTALVREYLAGDNLPDQEGMNDLLDHAAYARQPDLIPVLLPLADDAGRIRAMTQACFVQHDVIVNLLLPVVDLSQALPAIEDYLSERAYEDPSGETPRMGETLTWLSTIVPEEQAPQLAQACVHHESIEPQMRAWAEDVLLRQGIDTSGAVRRGPRI